MSASAFRRHVRRWIILRTAIASNALPRPVARWLGRLIGWWLYATVRRERARAIARVHMAFGWPEVRCRRLVRRCAVTFGAYLADALRLAVWSPDDLMRRVRLYGLAHLRAALAEGTGAFVLSAHVGNWELLAAALAASGIPLSVVARRPGDAAFARRIEALRGRWGIELLWRDMGARPILRALKRGRAVGVLIDQATDVAGAYVPFFGHPAYTPLGPARIALRMGTPVVPAHMCDGPDGSYLGIIEPPMCIAATGSPVELTAAWTRHIERWIRQAPHTWVWMHDRWRVVRPVKETVGA